jgi:hypothetical protein
MRTSTIKRMLAGLTLALVASGGLTIHGAGRASADGNLSDCFRAGGVCQAASETSGGALGASPFRVVVPPAVTATENELPPNPYVDLAITLAGQNFDRSPIIQISNLGNEDSGQFEILQLSPPGEREKLFTNLAGGQSVIYHDPSYPADCGGPNRGRYRQAHERGHRPEQQHPQVHAELWPEEYAGDCELGSLEAEWGRSRREKKQSFQKGRGRRTGSVKSGRRVSNSRPSAWEADALPTELLPRGYEGIIEDGRVSVRRAFGPR